MNKEMAGKSPAQLISRILSRKGCDRGEGAQDADRILKQTPPPDMLCFESLPACKNMRFLQAAAARLGIGNPFFKTHEGLPGPATQVDGRRCDNFSHYNYLGLAGHGEVEAAAVEAVRRYGTSAGASRLVAGERPVQRDLERALADLYGVEDCVVFVSGHATNVSTISTLFGPGDLVVHDSLAHNSILEGIRLSGATRRFFAHNDTAALDDLLAETRLRFQRALIVVEGLYSMDGDIPDLPALVEIKKRHGAFLMVDEAHALGVLGETGRGAAEHFGLSGADVDIWMGTLSKTLASCGGYIAGSASLVEILKHHAPGFVYSVGISPPLAAAALAAVRVLLREPERVSRLRGKARLFLEHARAAGLNTGLSQGFSIAPVIVGSSRRAVALSNALFEQSVNVQPLIHPAVEEKAARLRFFLSSEHGDDAIRHVCRLLGQLTQS